MKTRDIFRQMHTHALIGDGPAIYMCVSEANRAWAWRQWKDCGWLEVADAAEHDGPPHDNKTFITRYGNGATVSFRLASEALL